jgi:hypothetical protein
VDIVYSRSRENNIELGHYQNSLHPFEDFIKRFLPSCFASPIGIKRKFVVIKTCSLRRGCGWSIGTRILDIQSIVSAWGIVGEREFDEKGILAEHQTLNLDHSGNGWVYSVGTLFICHDEVPNVEGL